MTTKPIPMSDADRDALSKKRDAASPGRWTAQRMEYGAWLVRTDDGGVPYSVAQIPQSRPGYTSPNDRADAVFIAESYNALPSLLSALAASEERARRAEAELADRTRYLTDKCGDALRERDEARERARRAEQALRGMVNSHTGECNDGSGECCSACAVALSELEPRCACTWTADFRDHGEARRGPHHNRKVCPMWAPAPSAPATNEEPKR